MQIKSAISVLLFSGLIALAGCKQSASQSEETSSHQKVIIDDARLVLPAVKGNPGAAYFTLTYNGSAPASLQSVEITQAGKSEMHETIQDGAAMTMRPLDVVPLQNDVSLNFEPGGKHVMAFDLPATLKAGDETPIIFHFSDGEDIHTMASVRSVGDVR